MISGLRSREYEDRLAELGLTTLEERRHQADMARTYRIVTQKDDVDAAEWFTMAAQAARVTHTVADIRQNFFSVRVTEDWNRVPSAIKNLKTVGGFKNVYAKYRADTAHVGHV